MIDTYEFTVRVEGTRHWAKQLAMLMERAAQAHINHGHKVAPRRMHNKLGITVTTPRKVENLLWGRMRELDKKQPT